MHRPETHLIPNPLRAALGQGDNVSIFGDDYDKRDGTCVRDYIHVNDLTAARLKAMEFMDRHNGAHAFNLGSGRSFNVSEAMQAARAVTGTAIPCEWASHRAGDPVMLAASSKKARAPGSDTLDRRDRLVPAPGSQVPTENRCNIAVTYFAYGGEHDACL